MRVVALLVVVAFALSALPVGAEHEGGKRGKGKGQAELDRYFEYVFAEEDERDEDEEEDEPRPKRKAQAKQPEVESAKAEQPVAPPVAGVVPAPLPPRVGLPQSKLPSPGLLLVAGLALAGVAGIAAMRARREVGVAAAAAAGDAESYEAGRALAVRQPDPLAAMAALGLGRAEVLENGPRGGLAVVRGAPPEDGCAFRAGYLAGALGADVRETTHGHAACEFEIQR